jgi:hypothetical protein
MDRAILGIDEASNASHGLDSARPAFLIYKLHSVAECAAFWHLSTTLIACRSPAMLHACAAYAEACQDCGAGCDEFNGPELKHRARNCRD